MSVFNSSAGLNQDDSDITIINPSIIHEHHNEYVNNTQPTKSQATVATNNDTSTDDSSYGKHDYIFVDHNPQANAKQLEQVLTFYIRDLNHESKSQLDCDQQLVTRLMDLIRPAYPHDQQKMIELDKMVGEVAALHDKRHIEHKEKLEQLRTEICQLNRMLCLAREEHSLSNDTTRNYSAMNTIHRDSMPEYDQWTEIEDDARKLHQIVQTQKNQINEIVALISESATVASSLNPPEASVDNFDGTASAPQTPSIADSSFISTLLKKIHDITSHQETAATATPQETILENHSPGVSPTQSLATLTLTSINPAGANQAQQTEQVPESQVHPEEPIREEPPHSIDVPLPATSETQRKKCPVCSHQFETTLDDTDVYDHIDRCLFPSNPNPEPHDYECPECGRKLPGDDEQGYLQHLADCYNRGF